MKQQAAPTASGGKIEAVNPVGFDVKFRTQMENQQVELLSHKDLDGLLAEKCGPRYWEYREAWKKGMHLLEVPDFPLTLDIENLNHCNFACHHCMFSARSAHPDMRNRVPDRMMDFKTYQRAVDEGAEHGLAALTHGVQCEPTMHPDIVKMVEYASKKGVMDQRLGTNGSLLTTELCEQLVDAGLTKLEVSLDAFTEETYKKVRKGKDAKFPKIIANIHNFLDVRAKKNTKFPVLRVSMVKMNINQHELEDFAEYWKNYADFFSFQEPINYQMNLPNSAVKFKEAEDKEAFRCDKAYLRMFMRYDGTLYPCFAINIPGFESFSLGNIYDTTMKDAWNHEHVQYLRAIHRDGRYRDNKICEECVRNTQIFEG